jgi:hypothetical protein
LLFLHYFFTFIRKIILPLIPSNLANIGGFDITKDLLIMVVLHSNDSNLFDDQKNQSSRSGRVNVVMLAVIGLIVGFIIGFRRRWRILIIPALLCFGNLPMKQSHWHFTIYYFINSMIGFTGDLWEVCRLITNSGNYFDNGISRISDWHYYQKK